MRTRLHTHTHTHTGESTAEAGAGGKGDKLAAVPSLFFPRHLPPVRLCAWPSVCVCVCISICASVCVSIGERGKRGSEREGASERERARGGRERRGHTRSHKRSHVCFVAKRSHVCFSFPKTKETRNEKPHRLCRTMRHAGQRMRCAGFAQVHVPKRGPFV
jgi:hypothetical protein